MPSTGYQIAISDQQAAYLLVALTRAFAIGVKPESEVFLDLREDGSAVVNVEDAEDARNWYVKAPASMVNINTEGLRRGFKLDPEVTTFQDKGEDK